MSKKKKIVILSCLIALLAVTAVFNFVLSSKPASSINDTTIPSANYFTNYRTERITSRNEEILQLESVISIADPQSEEYKNALATKIELTEMTERELLLESLLKAYGFEDVVVVIGLDSDNVNVITKTEELTKDDAIAIYTVITDENIASPTNIKIIPIS